MNDGDINPDLVIVLEDVCEYFGKPVVIKSGLRCEKHNQNAGGSMELKQLFTNADGQLSTTSTIQMMSAITLCIGFVISLFLDRSVTAELGFIIAGMATLTATSNGFVSRKSK